MTDDPGTNPALRPGTAPAAVGFAAFLGQKVKPNASGERTNRCRNDVIENARGAMDDEFHKKQIGDEGKREDGGVQKSDNEKARAAKQSDDVREPAGNFRSCRGDDIHFAFGAAGKTRIVTELKEDLRRVSADCRK